MVEQSAIDKVEALISALNVKLEKLEAQIEEARAAGDKEEVAALREDKRQLSRREEQLRDKELLLLQRQPGALGILPAPAPSRSAHVSHIARLAQLRRRLPLCPRTAC